MDSEKHKHMKYERDREREGKVKKEEVDKRQDKSSIEAIISLRSIPGVITKR